MGHSGTSCTITRHVCDTVSNWVINDRPVPTFVVIQEKYFEEREVLVMMGMINIVTNGKKSIDSCISSSYSFEGLLKSGPRVGIFLTLFVSLKQGHGESGNLSDLPWFILSFN